MNIEKVLNDFADELNFSLRDADSVVEQQALLRVYSALTRAIQKNKTSSILFGNGHFSGSNSLYVTSNTTICHAPYFGTNTIVSSSVSNVSVTIPIPDLDKKPEPILDKPAKWWKSDKLSTDTIDWIKKRDK